MVTFVKVFDQTFKGGHDLKFDAIVLERHGVALRGIGTDTMLASYLIDANRSGFLSPGLCGNP